MTIKKLTEYYWQLNGIGFEPAAQEMLAKMVLAADVVKSNPVGNYEKCQSLIHEINAPLADFARHINDTKYSVLQEIDATDQHMYERSRQLYQEGRRDTADYIFSRATKNLLFRDAWPTFKERVQLYVSWQYPALEIRPLGGQLSRQLVGCDPLYVADTSDELLVKIKSAFTPEYQHRIRPYTIIEDSGNILGALPPGQFGLVVAHDYFHYRPIELIKQYAQEVFGLLRPGGHFVFAYNNCDLPNGVDLADNMFYCYTPGRKIRQLLVEYGYEIVASTDYNLNTSWIEARKPGTLSSIRGSQTLGKVVNI